MKTQWRDILRQVPWAGVIVILAAGILASTGIVLHAQSELEQEPTTAPNAPMHTLTFLNEQGEVWDQQQVAEGSFAVPPEVDSTNDGIVFRGWSQKLYDINRSTEMAPVYQDLRQEKNAFYMDSQCSQLDDEVEADLWLGGNVCLSSIQLVLEYDAEVLLEFACDVGNSPFKIISEEPGHVVLKLDEEQNLTESMCVAVLRFRINPDRADIAKTRIRIEMKDPALITDGGEVGANSCAVHGDIYLLS